MPDRVHLDGRHTEGGADLVPLGRQAGRDDQPAASVGPDYTASAKRYFGDQQRQAWVDQFPPDSQFWRIAVTPSWANVMDFETRFPSALSAG